MKRINKHLIAYFIVILSALLNAQWIQMPSSPTGYITNILYYEGVLYISHFNNGVFKSTDEGSTWEQINNGLNNPEAKTVFEVIAFNGNLYAATVDGIYKSTDNGSSWVKKSSGITIGPGALKEFCESISEFNGTLFTGAWNGIYTSTDGAENWTVTNATGQGINAKNFENHNGILFAARENINSPNGYFSTDNGLNWNSLTVLNFPTITFFSEGTKLWSGTIHGVWLSTDDGTSWEHRSNGLSPDPYSSSIIRVNGKLITSLKFGGSGIFSSTDDGLIWEDWGEGLPFLSTIEKLIIYNDKIIAASSDGLWQRDTSEVITVLENESNSPHSFALNQNYPNPFNPSTKIKFTIPSVIASGTKQSQLVILKVFDVLGNEVATLVNEEKPAGTYEVEFNSHSDGGQNLTSGIYFYKLQSSTFTETKKMILLK